MTAKQILLVDDDPDLLRIVEATLATEGLGTVVAHDGQQALDRLQTEEIDAVVLDLVLPDIGGKALLQRIADAHPGLPVVMLTAEGSVSEVVECMRLGAVDYVQKPFDGTRLIASVRNACRQAELRARVESLVQELRSGDGFGAILGDSPALRKSVSLLERSVGSDVTVLIEGESGTGKEIAARAVHAESGRRAGPFVAINCGAIPETLIESELFGHEKGAFTGATETRRGRFEQANGGTLFLDEIGELRLDLQVKLLRVLQEMTVQRVGGSSSRKVDVRVIAATNRDLKGDAAAGRFREDLYYRLAVFPVTLPPLRDREGDVELLAIAFMARFADRHKRPRRDLTDEAVRALRSHLWPGNVRELENVIERATLLEDGPRISLGSLSDEVVCALDSAGSLTLTGIEAIEPSSETADDILPLEDEERRIIHRALQLTGWNVKAAAQRLGIGRATIYRKIEKYQLGARP